MVDFVKSFRQGISLADIARKNREEIQEVFAELNAQLNSATGGKIRIYLTLDTTIGNILVFKLTQGVGAYNVVVASNPLIENSPVKHLARWSPSPEGYPCTITVGKTEYVCVNKKSLEETLATMLQDPSVGKSLQILLNLDAEQVERDNDCEDTQ